ncbi:uncharacterized protein [Primulina huaijiensis]|uniref:uncharacterized protein n=1 Tax=Primulina huaijiensis TaxID=1492673 RepID=UPI003CC76736
MDLDPSNIKNSDQRITRADVRYFAKDLGHEKEYKCTFCKRGFSNAQALGGHMNVHRKDRARLKEFSCENLLSLEINRTTDRGDSPPTEFNSSTSHKSSSPSESDTKEHSRLLEKDDDSRVVEEDRPIRDLPLFSEEPSVSEVGEKPGAKNFGKGHVEEELGSSRAVSRVEVDLELRLGPEPDHDASIKR